jgi:L-lactate dehydrogenase
MGLRQYCAANGKDYSPAVLEYLFQQTRNAAYEIIKRKKATFYAVAAGIVRIIEAIVRDQRTVLCVSSLVSDYYGMSDVCFSLPTIIGRNGVEGMLRLDLDESEIAALRRSYDVLKKTLDEVKQGV